MAGRFYPPAGGAPTPELVVFQDDFRLPFRARRLRLQADKEGIHMLETLAVLLLLFWAVGLVTSYTLSGFIHILLVAAVVVVLVRVIQGRRPI
jgi:Family of unknown function (DUF5670)